MSLKSLKKSSGLTALAVGLAALSIPSVASAAPGDHGRGGESRGGDNRGGGQVQQAPQQQQQAQPRNWGGDRNGDAAGRGWGQQAQGGNVERPMWRAAPQAQQQVQRAPVERQVEQRQVQRPAEQRSYSQERNRTYAAPDRNRAYTPQQQGWDGRQWQGQNNDRDRQVRSAPRYDNRAYNNTRGDSWSRDWRRDNRYNWQSYRTQNRQVYNLGRYYSPYSNWSYRRLNIGFYLQPLFFSQNYWLSDPWMYRLPPAYGPYRWVRYYDDALLVNIYDGEVVDVLYDFFW